MMIRESDTFLGHPV